MNTATPERSVKRVEIPIVEGDVEHILVGESSRITFPSASGEEAYRSHGGVDDPDPLFDAMDDGQSVNLPSHRAREANPLVRMVDDPKLTVMDGAISVKTRLSGRSAMVAPTIPEQAPKRGPSRMKPGPGRSSSGFIKNSLLTFQKGSLKSVKGSYTRPEESRNDTRAADDGFGSPESDEGVPGDETAPLSNHAISQAPPTADELLGLAGLGAQKAEEVSDFEDDLPVSTRDAASDTQLPLAPQPDPAQSALQQRWVSNITNARHMC